MVFWELSSKSSELLRSRITDRRFGVKKITDRIKSQFTDHTRSTQQIGSRIKVHFADRITDQSSFFNKVHNTQIELKTSSVASCISCRIMCLKRNLRVFTSNTNAAVLQTNLFGGKKKKVRNIFHTKENQILFFEEKSET